MCYDFFNGPLSSSYLIDRVDSTTSFYDQIMQ